MTTMPDGEDAAYVWGQMLKRVGPMMEEFAGQFDTLQGQVDGNHPFVPQIKDKTGQIAAGMHAAAADAASWHATWRGQNPRIHERAENPRGGARVEESADSGKARRDV